MIVNALRVFNFPVHYNDDFHLLLYLLNFLIVSNVPLTNEVPSYGNYYFVDASLVVSGLLNVI